MRTVRLTVAQPLVRFVANHDSKWAGRTTVAEVAPRTRLRNRG